MANPLNKVRYRYALGNQYYAYLGACIGGFWGLIFNRILIGTDLRNYIPLWAGLLLLIPLGWICIHFSVDIFLKMTPDLRIKTVTVGLVNCYLIFIGIDFLLISNSILFPIMGWFFIIVGCTICILIYRKVIQMRIYPDRIRLGKLILYYRDILCAKWGEGKDFAKNLNEQQKNKTMKVLTPILHEEHGKDFTIYHYYIVIEMPDIVYIAQPVYFKSSFVQNIRNGWIETWQWDGSTQMPDGWTPIKQINC